jgi:hypothetical protein
VSTVFPSSGPPQVLIFEPGTPQLVLTPADASAAPQRLDSGGLPAALGSELSINTATDGSGTVISYGTAVDYLDSSGTVHGPFSLATVGLLSINAAVALEKGAGAVLLGLGQSGPGWITLGPNGLGTLTTFDLAEVADATQPAPLLWDDGSGDLYAVVQLSSGQGTSLALFAAAGGGSPFVFGSPTRLDTQRPGLVNGFEAAVGPTGNLGILLSEGTSVLAGFAVDPSGTVSGGVIQSLSAAVTLQTPGAASVPWDVGCGAGGSCDPQLRYAGNGDLVAAWTLAGELNVARLPSGSSTWQSPQTAAGGPLLSPLATDAAGDLTGLAQIPAGSAIAFLPAAGAPGFQPLPQVTGLALGPFAAATGTSGGALWATEPNQPGDVFAWTLALGGGAPVAVPAVTLPGSESVASLGIAAATIPSSSGDSFFGTASPGWMLIGGSLDGSDDLLLTPFSPATGILGTLTSVAVSGWQGSTGVTSSSLFVDLQGDALVAFDQSVGNAASNLYFSSAAPGGMPSASCYAIPPLTNGGMLSLYVGASDLVVGYDAPATVSLAH